MSMILSDQCWLKETCKKYNNPKVNCECRSANIYCEKLFSLNYLYKESLLSPHQYMPIRLYCSEQDPDVAQFRTLATIEKDIVNFVQSGQNVYIHSVCCGNGKTSWAIKLLHAYLNKTWMNSTLKCKTLFINVPRFLLALKDNITNQSDYIDHIKQNVLSADLVVWDEVATKALSVYEHEHLLSLINTRLDCGKSNIYTSNLTLAEVQDKLGERLYSRITGMSVNIEFVGGDKRGAKRI